MTVRRTMLAIAALLVVAFGLSLLPLCDPPPLASNAYLQAVTAHEAVVCMATPAPANLGLRLRQGETVVQTLPPTGLGLRHALRVVGLEPATRYAFDVVDETGQVVDLGSFVTRSLDDARPVRFALLGDSGGQPFWSKLQTSPLVRLLEADRWLPVEDEPTAVAALLLRQEPAFWLHTGDVIYPDGALQNYAAGLFRPFAAVLRQAPVYPVLGNHDVMTENGAPFFSVFVLPNPSPNGRCFTFRDGPLRVVGLDLNGPVGPDHPSLQFLRQVASESSEPWLIVTSHFPVRSAYRDHPRADLVEHFSPLCRELAVDLVCAGHDHNYQRFGQPGETIEVVTGGGGKSLYPILYQPEGLVVAESEYHVCVVEIDGPVLRLTARAIDGRELDHFEIDKRSLLREGRLRGQPARLARVQALAE